VKVEKFILVENGRAQPNKCEYLWRLANQESVILPSLERKLTKNALRLNQSAINNFALYVLMWEKFARRERKRERKLESDQASLLVNKKKNIGDKSKVQNKQTSKTASTTMRSLVRGKGSRLYFLYLLAPYIHMSYFSTRHIIYKAVLFGIFQAINQDVGLKTQKVQLTVLLRF